MSPEEFLKLLPETAVNIGKYQSFRYRFSSAGDPCLRALVYDAQDYDDGLPSAELPGKLRWAMARECGNSVGEFLEAAAKRMGADTQRPVTLGTNGIKISGTVDVWLQTSIIDVKLVGEKSWKRRPHDKHRLQVNGYAVAAGKPIAGLLYVRGSTIFDEDSPELEMDLITWPADLELAKELVGVWEQVDQHRALRTLPERVYGATKKSFPCGWCRHQTRCDPPEEKET